MKSLLILAVLTLVAMPVSAEEIPNFCHQPEMVLEWEELNKKYPHDLNIQALHAMRIGLCEKIDRGDLTVVDGIAIFEALRAAVVNRAFQKQLDSLGGEQAL